MKNALKKQVIEVINSISRIVNQIRDKNCSEDERLNILRVSLDAVNDMENVLLKNLSEENAYAGNDIFVNMKNELLTASESTDDCNVNVQPFLDELSGLIEKESVTYDILFLPYKSSMWDSMESIWIAANEDERCNAYVMPIPYCDRNPDLSFGEQHYEGMSFPDYVPIILPDKYDIAVNKPDAVYIHNPFDNGNLITSVHSFFYSENLKKYTDMLIYVPYFVAGSYGDMESAVNSNSYPALKNVDMVAAQSEIHKEIFIRAGAAPENVKAFGSPKIDYALKYYNNPEAVPDEWKEKFNNKTVLLLNTSIKYALANGNWVGEIFEIIKRLCEDRNVALIWRPHPLLELTINDMIPEWKDAYRMMKEFVDLFDNALIDTNEDIIPAIAASDGLISDYSSIIMQYMATNKPIYCIHSSSADKEKCVNIFDYFCCYFKEDGLTIDEFIENIVNNKDPLKEKRMLALKNTIENSDGTSGQKIHDYVIKQISI